MDTILNEILASQAKTILNEHKDALKVYEDWIRTSSMETAHKLRELLVPILNRWGIGWLGKHGIWTYPKVGDHTVIIPNEEVHVLPGGYWLDTLHPELFHALFEDYKASTGYLFHYVEPVPLPPAGTVSYVWVMSRYERDVEDEEWGTLAVHGTFSCSLTAMFHPLRIEGQHYHGPITQEYYQDVVDSGGNPVELVQYLPTYKAGPKGSWILDRDWDEDYYYTGKVDDCC